MIDADFTKRTSRFLVSKLLVQGADLSLASLAAFDLQLNGITMNLGKSLKTVDFSNPNLSHDDVRQAAVGVYSSGTPYFLATMVSSTREVMMRNGKIISEVMKEEIGKGILGIHFEGPCIDEETNGAHKVPIIKTHRPTVELFKAVDRACDGAMAMVTMSPNHGKSAETIQWLTNRKVVVSLGHFRAKSWENIERAIEAGATGLTHIGNAGSKEFGQPGHENDYGAKRMELHWMLTHPKTVPMVIADFIHVDKTYVRQTFATAQNTLNTKRKPKRVVTVSDQSAIAGAKNGTRDGTIYHGIDPAPVIELTNGHLLSTPLTGSCHFLGHQAMLLSAAGFKEVSNNHVLASVNRNPFELMEGYLRGRNWRPDIRHLERCRHFGVADWQNVIAEGNASERHVLEAHAKIAKKGFTPISIDDWLAA